MLHYIINYPSIKKTGGGVKGDSKVYSLSDQVGSGSICWRFGGRSTIMSSVLDAVELRR